MRGAMRLADSCVKNSRPEIETHVAQKLPRRWLWGATNFYILELRSEARVHTRCFLARRLQ